jgi:alkylation response protein AidB-like acyl-CoA dehydrogenase
VAAADAGTVVTVRPPDFTNRLSAAELATITPRRLVERVEAVVPFVTAHAAEAEAQRRPVDAVVDAIHATGVFHHFVPQRYGGLEFGVMDFVDNMLPLGAADASTGWVTAFCMEHNLLLAMFPEEAQDEIFGAQPYVIAPGCAFPPGVATRVPGGFRLSGRWRYASGVMHADWALGIGLDEADPTDVRWFAFPLAAATVYDVWRMDGMAATGSNDFAVTDLFVPEHRTVRYAEMGAGDSPGGRLHANPMYRVSVTAFLGIASAVPIVGAAQGVVDRCREQLAGRVSMGVKQAERPAVQMALAQSATEVHLAELGVRDAVEQLMRMADSEHRADVPTRARLRAQVVGATALARDAARRLVDVMGTTVHEVGNPVQRALRDISTATGHVLHDRSASMELHGRVLLGLDPSPTLF